jgi:hypothetical protein
MLLRDWNAQLNKTKKQRKEVKNLFSLHKIELNDLG